MTFREQYPLAWEYHRNTQRRRGAGPAALDLDAPQEAPKELPLAPYFTLPPPGRATASLSDALTARLSCRRFSATPLRLAQLATLLGSAYGMTTSSTFGRLEFPDRPVPSAGALYPLELYALACRVEDVPPGVYHYAAVTHGLEQVREIELPERFLGELFMGQAYAGGAAVVLVIAVVPDRTLKKYGDRGYRYALFEAGHVAQNVGLVVAATGLGAFSVGGFFDDELSALLMLDPEQEVPLYAVAVGVPDGGDRSELRTPGGPA